ncbi:hypothetical protein CAEBREN_32431 [Caenorhabditis brenneri]|uniref:Major sperm protein n=1 Tax=Caenorhabditis brenneri TaxID=135651 RepID=G0NVU0_CAEBE|nr:hypothetical protein CAEBREN_32431 [Caenorhabditis brenneri]
MVSESYENRSIRNDYDHAGGDNIYHLQSKTTVLKNEMSDLNVEMVEDESILQNHGETRYLGGLIGNKEIIFMSFLALCLYLVNGEYAQNVCTALTSVPPAIFSYRVLMNQQTTKQGYHTILFYWTLYGLVALVDQFVGAASGYNLCKGGLLTVVFFHALRSNSAAVPASWKLLDQVSVDVLTSIISRYANEGCLADKVSGYVPRTPTMTEFSDDSLQYLFESTEQCENYKMDVSTARSFIPSLEMQSTQNASSGLVQNRQTSSLKTMQIGGDKSRNQLTVPYHLKNDFKSMSAMTMTNNGNDDIVTVPASQITFSSGTREKTIQLTNVSEQDIMFALKTNADAYLIAAPTSGVLFSGETMYIRIGVTAAYYDEVSDPGISIDKVI